MNQLSRRKFLKLATVAAGSVVVNACGKKATPTATSPEATKVVEVKPTTAPEATKVPEVKPTSVPEATKVPEVTSTTAPAAADPWAIYPDDDPRHWWVDKLIEPAKKYDNLVVTQNTYTPGGVIYKEGESVEDNVVTRWINDKTGVHYKSVWSGPDANMFFQTAMASGDFPDHITQIPGSVLSQLLEADQLADFREIWDKTASELTKKLLLYPPNYTGWEPNWGAVSDSQGHLFGIPCGMAYVYEDVLWYRQDWLDKLKLAPPKTFDEVVEVGKALVKEGLATIGLGVAPRYTGWGTMSFAFGPFGTIPTLWRRGSDGMLTYDSLNPAQKEGLAVMQKLYKEGVIDPDFFVGDKTGENVGGNKVGLLIGPYFMPIWPMPDSLKNDPNAKWSFTEVPGTTDGKRGIFGDFGIGYNWSAFKKGTDPLKIEAYINGLNWQYEIHANQKCGSLPNGGYTMLCVPGYDYEYDKASDELKVGKYNTLFYSVGPFGHNDNVFPSFDVDAANVYIELLKKDPKTLNPIQRYITNDPTGLTQLGKKALSFVPTLSYKIYNDNHWPTPSSVAEILTSLNKLEGEAYTQIITGKASVDAWDTFASDWMKQGGDKVIKAVNDEDAKHKA
jgi:putative aldouronate transport system substrate-binding protein